MPLSWNEIRDRATAFAAEWKHTKEEDAEAKSFLDAFFEVFGVRRRKVASFEKRVNARPKLDSDAQRVAFHFSLYKHLTELEERAGG